MGTSALAPSLLSLSGKADMEGYSSSGVQPYLTKVTKKSCRYSTWLWRRYLPFSTPESHAVLIDELSEYLSLFGLVGDLP